MQQMDLVELDKRLHAEKTFLLKEGWTFTPNDILLHPETGKSYTDWFEAIAATVDPKLKNDGWFPVVTTTRYPRAIKLKDSDFCYYAHANYNRLFLWSDLINAYIYGIDPTTIKSAIALAYEKSPSLKSITYQPGMRIIVNMWVENENISNPIYELVEIIEGNK